MIVIQMKNVKATSCSNSRFFFPDILSEMSLSTLECDVWYLTVSEPPLSPTSGRVEGEVKLSISYRNSTLFTMVMHIRDLVNSTILN